MWDYKNKEEKKPCALMHKKPTTTTHEVLLWIPQSSQNFNPKIKLDGCQIPITSSGGRVHKLIKANVTDNALQIL